ARIHHDARRRGASLPEPPSILILNTQRGALRCWRRIVLNLWHAYIRAAQVGWDANLVVAMRLMRLAVGGALAQREAQRMVAEKVAAIAEAQAAAITKMIMGGGMAAGQNPLPPFISGRCGQTDVALHDVDFVSTRASCTGLCA